MSQPPDGEDLDRILIERIRKGGEPEKSLAQERLYKRWCSRVYKSLLRKGFTEAECEELTQDVFLRVFNSIDDFRGDSFGSWLWTIVASVYKNEVRRRRTSKRDARETSLDQAQEDDPALLVDRSSSGSNALDGILDKEKQKDLHRAIRRMPPKMQSCCYMRYVQGLKYREIAVILKISLGTVKAHLAQAKERLRDELGIDLAPEPGD